LLAPFSSANLREFASVVVLINIFVGTFGFKRS
jgi:hypothetical protein